MAGLNEIKGVSHPGKVRVLVREDDAEAARGLLAEAQTGQLPLEHGEATPM